jgi:Raf kinase inhibitor-like YbhB/YbcL family protein
MSKRAFGLLVIVPVIAGIFVPALPARDDDRFEHEFRVSSTTFTNNMALPITAINNRLVNNVNVCSVDGSLGGNQSPELSWTGAPRRTRTFVVVLYDVTASFTHWAMYNIPGTASGLPANAGARGSTYGTNVSNSFGNPEYDGPCPPANVTPYVHQYVFTVYALDGTLQLTGSTNFAPNFSTLYQALIEAGRRDHILASASITGLYSTHPGAL